MSNARTTRPQALLALALLPALAGVLAACGDSSQTEVASVAAPTTTAAGADLLPKFVSCLNDADIPATISDKGELEFPEDSAVTIAVDSGGETQVEVDGLDVSEAWARCKEQNPGVQPLPDPNDLDVAAMNAAGAEWAACLRDNGYPSTSDPENGMVLLPSGLTAEGAAALAAVCPTGTGDIGFGISAPDGWTDEQMTSVFDALTDSGAVAVGDQE